MDEQALIQAARTGDLEAYNRLVLAYQDTIYYQAYSLLGEREAAEDFTQDAFLTAYRNLPNFRNGSFRAWLSRIITHACFDELRRRKRRPTIPLIPVDKDDEEIESPEWLADPSPSPEDMVERKDTRTLLQRYLDQLPDDFRSAILLVDVHGLDYHEAAEALNIPVGTVKSRLARARLRLRDQLAPVFSPSPQGAII